MKDKPSRPGPDADEVALRVLDRLVSDPERLGRFLMLTGLRPDTIRDVAGTPHFLSAVLEHVASDETLLIEVAAEAGVPPAAIETARRRLAPEPDWSP